MTQQRSNVVNKRMDISFAYSFDWLHNLIYLYNISTLPSKQVIRTKRINPILKWMTIALRLVKKRLLVDTDAQTGNRKTSREKPPEPPTSICPRNKTLIYYGRKNTQFTKECSFFFGLLNSPRYK